MNRFNDQNSTRESKTLDLLTVSISTIRMGQLKRVVKVFHLC